MSTAAAPLLVALLALPGCDTPTAIDPCEAVYRGAASNPRNRCTSGGWPSTATRSIRTPEGVFKKQPDDPPTEGKVEYRDVLGREYQTQFIVSLAQLRGELMHVDELPRRLYDLRRAVSKSSDG